MAAKKTVKKTKSSATASAAKKPAAKHVAGKKPAAQKTAGEPVSKKATRKASVGKSVAKASAGRKQAVKSTPKSAPKTSTKKKVVMKKVAVKKPARKAVAKKPSTPSAAKTKSKAATGAPDKRPGKQDSAKLREMLVEMRERIATQVSKLKDESLYRTDEIITGEEGTDVFDRQFALNLACSEQESLHDIDDAIRRIDEGLYGICEECSCVIGKARLKALPFVRLCVECQSKKERNRRRFSFFV